MRKFIAGAASFLVLAGGSGMAHAVTSEQVPNEVVTNGTVDQRRVSSLELSREPNGESVRLFVCGGLGLQVVRESVGVSHG
ncbi:hypothetical protein ACQX4O_08775 [Corynebacterium diphtheriae]